MEVTELSPDNLLIKIDVHQCGVVNLNDSVLWVQTPIVMDTPARFDALYHKSHVPVAKGNRTLSTCG